MTAPARHDAIVVGAGLAGLVTAKQLLDRGLRVALVEKGGERGLGGLALQAFGGMMLVDTPLQRRAGIRDSAALAWSDWLSFAEFDAEDVWPRRWAERYIERCVPDVYEWLQRLGVRFIPAVQWVERGWMGPGNSLPRYHVLWGTAQFMTARLLLALRQHARFDRLELLTGHRVEALVREGAAVVGCRGRRAADDSEFELRAGAVVISGGGITGDLARVRRHWPRDWGNPPAVLLNGSHPAADGRLHDAVDEAGGQLTHLDRMWNYAAGVRHPNPQFEDHGLSLIPSRTAIWTDPAGQRIGPVPFVSGYDTLHMVRQIARAGWPHTWQVLNRRIAERELAASGAEHNPLIRDRRMLPFGLQMLRGNPALVDELLARCSDFVQAPDLATLAERMNALAGDGRVTPEAMEASIRPYDEQMRRGRRFHNDDQLRRIAQLRAWTGDRVRTCNFQPILDAKAGPLIAIRCQLLTRKSTGGIQTDLHSRVIGRDGEPIAGLYAAGEAAGFGGGGCSGRGSLEGTFLSGCILTAQAAAAHVAG
ncbi:MAG TPA: FAD-binding dehydrogenase [Ramlibacter sp.]|uniref:FAD-binding dehydrogenase n=1 Tax=Ramlibacter sp. TaxID=1917967 RepID=UPI002D7E210A|nr:FAD-binding dehydrogenase [Ramlibacter sp.]HET8746701.1 FAD-binding dehydrogenase [Ramlibacter sp.]